MTKPKSTMPLSNIAEINPSVNLNGLQDADEVSFVPMVDVTESGRWINRQTRPLKDVRVGYTCFQEGDVLFAKITPCMENGKGAHAIGLVNGFGFGSTEFHVLRAKGENSPRFIFHWLQSTEARSRAIAYMGGSAGQQRVQRIFFDKFEIPELASEEQVRAAEILDTLEGAIEKSEALIAKLKQVRAGMLHDLLTCGVAENGEVRNPAIYPHQFKDSPIGLIPCSWSVQPLSYYIASLDAGVSVNADDRPHGSGEIGVLKTSALTNGEFNPEQNKTVVAGERVLVKEPVLGNSILISRMNTPQLVGESCYVEADWPSLFLPDRIWQVKTRLHDAIHIRWLSYFLRTPYFRKYIEVHATGTSGSMKNLPKERLMSILVPFPEYLEQEEISHRLKALDIQIELEDANLQKLRSTKAGIAADLLTGQVRVPPDLELP